MKRRAGIRADFLRWVQRQDHEAIAQITIDRNVPQLGIVIAFFIVLGAFVPGAKTFFALRPLETALSFLGFGVRSPLVSWGLMLNDALRAGLGALEIYPWILTPMIPVILVVLAFSFVGDALRDALDPYS